jgi:hypothetical protein
VLEGRRPSPQNADTAPPAPNRMRHVAHAKQNEANRAGMHRQRLQCGAVNGHGLGGSPQEGGIALASSSGSPPIAFA